MEELLVKQKPQIDVWRDEIRRDVLKKAGDACLLNDLVKHFQEGKSNPQVHLRLKNGLTEKHGFRLVKKDERWIVVRTR